MMRRALLILSLLGFGAFATIFAISFTSPLTLEWAAREIVRFEVERRVGARIEALSNSKVAALAQKALGKTDAELQEAKRALIADVPRRAAEAAANMLNADCECRKRLAEAAIRNQEERITTLGQARDRLAALIESAYASVTTSLLRELRIFAAANALAFALLGVVSFVRRGATLQLLLPAAVLIGAVAITVALYLFNQNWLHTILYSEYVGLAYIGYLALAATFLADVVFNRARLTTRLANTCLNLVGSALQAVPC